MALAGDICVNTLKRDWTPDTTLAHILQVIRCLLIVPFPESSLNDEAGKFFMESYDEYFRKAKLWTSIHAVPAGGTAAAAGSGVRGSGAAAPSAPSLGAPAATSAISLVPYDPTAASHSAAGGSGGAADEASPTSSNGTRGSPSAMLTEPTRANSVHGEAGAGTGAAAKAAALPPADGDASGLDRGAQPKRKVPVMLDKASADEKKKKSLRRL